jgi:hypothetical protein
MTTSGLMQTDELPPVKRSNFNKENSASFTKDKYDQIKMLNKELKVHVYNFD